MEKIEKLNDLRQVFEQLEGEAQEQVLLAAKRLMTAQVVLRRDLLDSVNARNAPDSFIGEAEKLCSYPPCGCEKRQVSS